jgi:hypothetical protein
MNDRVPDEGTITIRWKRLPEPLDTEAGVLHFVWAYEPDPAIPDEDAERILREVADRI